MKRQRVMNDKFKIQFWVDDKIEIYEAMFRMNWKLTGGQEIYITVGEFIEEIIGRCSEPRLYEYCWTVYNLIDIKIREGTISGGPVWILDFINEPISLKQAEFY